MKEPEIWRQSGSTSPSLGGDHGGVIRVGQILELNQMPRISRLHLRQAHKSSTRLSPTLRPFESAAARGRRGFHVPSRKVFIAGEMWSVTVFAGKHRSGQWCQRCKFSCHSLRPGIKQFLSSQAARRRSLASMPRSCFIDKLRHQVTWQSGLSLRLTAPKIFVGAFRWLKVRDSLRDQWIPSVASKSYGARFHELCRLLLGIYGSFRAERSTNLKV